MSIMTLLMKEGGVTAVQQFLWHPGQFTVSITTISNSCLCVHFLYFSHDNFLVSCQSKLTNLPACCRLSLWSRTFDICPSETFQPEQKGLAGLKEDVGRARLSQPPLSSVLPSWSICTALHEKMVMALFYSKIHLVNYNISSRRNIVWQLKW